MIKDVNVTIGVQKIVGEIGVGIPIIVYTATTAVAYKEMLLEAASEVSEIADFVDIIKNGDNPPEKIAAIGLVSADYTSDKIKEALKAVEDKSWRQVVLYDLDENTSSKAIMDYIETTDKVLLLPYSVLPTSVTATDYERTIVVSGSTTSDFDTAIENIACILGATCGLEVGSFTYKNMIVKGGNEMANAAYITATTGSSAVPFLAILEKAGDTVISDGCTLGGDFIDLIDSKDYIINQLEYQTQKLLNAQKKIPYTNGGVSLLETVANNVLQTAYNNGMIAENEDGSPAFSVTYGIRENAEAENIQERKYIDGAFTFVLSGAIHTVKINGIIKYV